MRKLMKKTMAMLIAALALTMTLGMTVFAAGKDTNTYDFVTSQAVNAERGGSTQIQLFARERFKVFLLDNNSQDTYAVIDNGQDIGNASVTVYIGADETSPNVAVLFYAYDRDFYDCVNVRVNGSVQQTVIPGTPAGSVMYDFSNIGDYNAFNQKMAAAIYNAQPGEVVILNTGARFNSFTTPVRNAWAARPDVTVAVRFMNQNQPCTVIVPAGSNVNALFNADGYCGFMYLAGLYGVQ
ncbi:MAG: hypothetical protein J6M46_02675 [Lachnospiraceae bacterium]|nr:hypothetical protein [Lachnospiraceae bacterium]